MIRSLSLFALVLLFVLGSVMLCGGIALDLGLDLVATSSPAAAPYVWTALIAGGALAIAALTAVGFWFYDRSRRISVVIGDELHVESPRMRQARASRLVSMLLVAIAGAGLLACSDGCGAVKDQAKAVAGDAVDCTEARAAQLERELGPIAEKAVVSMVTSDGKIDRASLKQAAINFVTDDARCVLAKAFARFVSPPAAEPGAPKSSPLDVDAGDARAAWDELARDELGGRHFHTAAGDL